MPASWGSPLRMEPFACSPAPLALKAVTSHRTPQSSPFWSRPRFSSRQPGNREDYGVRRSVAALASPRSGETGQTPRSARYALKMWAKISPRGEGGWAWPEGGVGSDTGLVPTVLRRDGHVLDAPASPPCRATDAGASKIPRPHEGAWGRDIPQSVRVIVWRPGPRGTNAQCWPNSRAVSKGAGEPSTWQELTGAFPVASFTTKPPR